MRRTTLAAIVGLAVVASAGLTAGAYAGQSVWGDANPGQGAAHANMPAAGLEHNQAGAEHPPAFAGQPEELPPVDTGQPDDVPPEDAGQPDDVPPEDAGMPDELPEQANEHAEEHYPPAHIQA